MLAVVYFLVAALATSGGAAQNVNMQWCYSSTQCSADCVRWSAADGTCYPGTNGAAAARIFVNTSVSPPQTATLVAYTTSVDCSGAAVAAVPLLLDGVCHALENETQSYRASNGAATAAVPHSLLWAVAAVLLSAFQCAQ